MLKKLVIISHTDHQRTSDGEIVGWGPTVNEINHLALYWEEVVHVACFDEGIPKGTSIPYTAKNVRIVPIKPFGGKSLRKKINMLTDAPSVLNKINHAIEEASHVQIRVPMGIGLYVLPFFRISHYNRKFLLWVKYANNWVQKNPPLGYGLQRWFLKKNYLNCKVTVNGAWPRQSNHCITFENPCLRRVDIEEGNLLTHRRTFVPPYKLVFIGRLEDAKGVRRILLALNNITTKLIEKITFIGQGDDLDKYLEMSSSLPHLVEFLGAIPQKKVHQIIKQSDFLLLPTTASEGFPKVIAEAACFGCIPITTDVASIGQYVKNEENGFLIEQNEIDYYFTEFLNKSLSFPVDRLKELAINAHKISTLFTYEAYFNKLNQNIFND